MAFACRGDMVHASFTIDAPFSGEKETGRLPPSAQGQRHENTACVLKE